MKLVFYVPASHVEQVKNALFSVGAGKIGHYSHCAWQVLGEGQFMPNKHSHAFIGEKNRLEKIPEYCVEMVCQAIYIKMAIAKLKSTHPYEEPAYQVIALGPY